jgi:hypothetical protein
MKSAAHSRQSAKRIELERRAPPMADIGAPYGAAGHREDGRGLYDPLGYTQTIEARG